MPLGTRSKDEVAALGKDEVAGSNPAISSIKPVRNDWFSYDFGRFLQGEKPNLQIC